MKAAYRIASKQLGNCKSKKIQRKDYTARCATSLRPGDRVLICNMSQRGSTGKLRNFLKEEVLRIIQVLDKRRIVCNSN